MTAKKTPRVRFAPSPTGELHVGNARTALFNWLYARHYGGRFILRIEDTDQVRTKKVYEENLIRDLKWLGLEWDEGPEKEGSFGPYHQLDRLPIYKKYLDELIVRDLVYPCYCTEEELEAERTLLLARRQMPRYMGKCRHLTAEARKKLEAEGRKPAMRFKVENGEIGFRDLIRGAIKFQAAAIGDFIVVRSSGIPAYNFAVVIDDHLMGITQVIRGEDHLTNTALQLLIYRAFSFEPPDFAHHSLILGKDRAKLSKRHGSVAIREFREQGFLPEVMVNYLSLLGSSISEGREVCSLDGIIADFSLDRAGKSGAIFDEDKLRWLNAHYIRQEDPRVLAGRLMPYIEAAAGSGLLPEKEWLVQVVELLRDNIVTLNDINDYLGVFIDEKYSLTDEAREFLDDATAFPVLQAFGEILSVRECLDAASCGAIIRETRERTGVKGKKLFMTIRAAVTGRTSGPELDRIFPLLGKESILCRLEKAREMTGKTH